VPGNPLGGKHSSFKKVVMVMGGSIGGHSLKQSIIEVAKRDSLKNHIFV